MNTTEGAASGGELVVSAIAQGESADAATSGEPRLPTGMIAPPDGHGQSSFDEEEHPPRSHEARPQITLTRVAHPAQDAMEGDDATSVPFQLGPSARGCAETRQSS
jgi:hypothetical protein